MKSVHSEWMKYALREAEKAFEKNEIPVGCVIVKNNSVIAKAYNQVEMLNDPTAHCEMIALTSAFDSLGTKHLSGCSIYVTLEPCSMCAGALVLAKIDNVYFGAFDNKAGACGSVLNVISNKALNHRITSYGGILDAECGSIIKCFFDIKRKNGNKGNIFSKN